jgi:hypothetical protein
MSANARPIWILVGGYHPVALATLKKKRFPSGATHWCHEGDSCWLRITAADRARLERHTKSRKRSASGPVRPVVRESSHEPGAAS